MKNLFPLGVVLVLTVAMVAVEIGEGRSVLVMPLPMPISYSGPLPEYCVLKEESSGQERLAAGTPVPMTPVVNGLELGQVPPPTEVSVAPATSEPQIVSPTDLPVTVEPTATPNLGPPFKILHTDDDFSPRNFHVLFVGVGYTSEENPVELAKLIEDVRGNFEGLRVDFAYVDKPFDLAFVQQSTTILFENDQERVELLAVLRSRYPVDSVIIAVKTNVLAGTSLNNGSVIILTSNNPAANYITTHELGHQLGLGDAYQVGYYKPAKFPNSEFFYLDDMPNYLVKALNQLGTMPPMFEAGTCNGRKLYTFYDNFYNLMGLYVFNGPRPWGDSAFTPLQLQIMKDKIVSLRGE
ncbi:hypothetical protein A3K29_05585 [Candidatus Collierbacteria bacterium RIFOXYB2_FULL_46_14]|uniref:Uncharacterized protein n=1 Tax=Candidatus Collierbacteria bacterium GW2011_GWA2_46_26 TaxID=1618381 RepID=A0A0G1PIN5_9BACT|nr:MAG: hypothetical protein UX47_C0009G0043 [Candidatus Collierbacteria bacterium GW2011_GWA2_46_26]OGD73560.1 MAG: hypothetical protein A3K29_05585 [Candidatus Collierbacteria bacterium RIFOXYB2_FULL_46_14]OGD76602.1 MAG: hypothetical protein A3K43_05585 [Candidatus Collierbacteria bacterium RIFOXYA2_FULL_46_20]OGD77938.1 MAG: hypothetical protein A3K39_05585 [Candidatus Collierbacteria bacterium RIFOXYC2_FULL_43_15]OGD79962.1 MAG: hypothetical protein A2320_00015 [Pseudomonadales bacterium G